ncbi:hypothetical protein FACS1894182_05760 [Bacteroidia bacterium]|nr:hypothetical protein FACS1894182_05760 [Bacteroidia bacterium]
MAVNLIIEKSIRKQTVNLEKSCTFDEKSQDIQIISYDVQRTNKTVTRRPPNATAKIGGSVGY